MYSGRPAESIPEFRLTRELLDSLEMMVLPETEVLSTPHANLIRDWVANGGTLMASYRCGLLDENRQARPDFPLADVFGVHFAGEEKKYAYDDAGKLKSNFISTYLEPSGHDLARPLAARDRRTAGLISLSTTHHRPGGHALSASRDGGGSRQKPVVQLGSASSGKETAGLAVAYNKFGKGQAVYMGAPLFRAMSTRTEFGNVVDRPYWLRAWMHQLIRQLIPNPVAEIVPTPFTEYLHGSFFYDPAGSSSWSRF